VHPEEVAVEAHHQVVVAVAVAANTTLSIEGKYRLMLLVASTGLLTHYSSQKINNYG
jgi:hypothetical protein